MVVPDLQWQDNNNIVAFVPESPSALNQDDARGQTFPVLDGSPSDFLPWTGTNKEGGQQQLQKQRQQ